jgi:LacI family transcriptional regulator
VPTIKDIARAAGVSVATVSYVLNDTRYVSPDKKERVLHAVKQLNYVPNAVARGLRVRESRTISLIVSDITNPFYPDLAKACEDYAHEFGYTVNMVNTSDDPKRLAQALEQLRKGKVDGAIVTTAMEADRPILEQFIREGYPIVLAHRRLEGLDGDIVVSDNYGGSVAATKHLLALGHTRIAFMTGVPGSTVSLIREQGYRDAMHEAGVEVRPEWILTGDAKYAPSFQATRELLQLPRDIRPTAVINISDIGALGVLDAAYDMGVIVPDDLAVVGFDDLFIAASRCVQLTTIKIPRYELGRTATELLLNRISGVKAGQAELVTLPVELIVRRTCGSKAVS